MATRNVFEISLGGELTMSVTASNWMVALGTALETFDWIDDADRLACEVLPNGVVVVSDLKNQVRYAISRKEPTELGATA